MMNRYAIGIFITTLGIAACSSCSNGSSGNDGGGGGGSCKHVDICNVIPLATVNSGTNKVCGSTSSTPTDVAIIGDECDYTGTGNCGYVTLIRNCWDDPMLETVTYEGDRGTSLAMGGTRMDITGVGDKAFYQTEPTGAGVMTSKVQLEAYKKPVLVILRASGVAPADEAKVKQSLMGYANTLLQ